MAISNYGSENDDKDCDEPALQETSQDDIDQFSQSKQQYRESIFSMAELEDLNRNRAEAVEDYPI